MNPITQNAATFGLTVTIIPNEKGNPPGKLADVELVFSLGPLAGMRLQGFAIWERRAGSFRNVTFPARQYSVNGERRSFALLRPVTDAAASMNVRDLIVAAYEQHEQQAADVSPTTDTPAPTPDAPLTTASSPQAAPLFA